MITGAASARSGGRTGWYDGAAMDTRSSEVAELARACREETARFRRGAESDDTPCMELFRRAVVGRDEAAWTAVVEQYHGVVLAWVRQHPAAAAAPEDDEFWVGRTFQRFWMALESKGLPFPELGAVLRYLKMCAHSVLLDEVRSRQGASAERLPDEEGETTAAPGFEIEEPVLGRLAARELWAAIERELDDAAERLAVYLSFALGMKPGQMHERHPERFATVDDAYRIKRNALDRLRRSHAIRAFLDDEPQNHAGQRSSHERWVSTDVREGGDA